MSKVIRPVMMRKINVSPGFLYAALKSYQSEKNEQGTRPVFLEINVMIPRGAFNGEFDNDEEALGD